MNDDVLLCYINTLPDGFFLLSSPPQNLFRWWPPNELGSHSAKNSVKCFTYLYCKNLHLFILFCIDNLNWMLENWNSVHINKLKKGKRQKEKSKWICMYWLVYPAPQRYAAQSDLNFLAKQPLCSWLVWPLLLCFLVPSAWCHDDYIGWPIAFLLWLPVLFFSVLHACSFRWVIVESPVAEGCCWASGWPETHREEEGVSWQMDGSDWTSGTFAVCLPKWSQWWQRYFWEKY